MSFVMPSKYGSDLPLPKDPSVMIKEVPRKVVAVVAFSVSFKLKKGASVEVAQYNPPFTFPFTRRNEIVLKVEKMEE
ncbi:hypothetical protein REPUB_Repub02eG0220500 [Reevesia pubescens]